MYAHVHLGLSTFDVTHVRKCTRPSLLYRTASDEKMGVGLGTRVIQGDIPGPHCVSANYVSTKCVTIVTLIEVAMVIYYKPTLITPKYPNQIAIATML